jgi:hypothetical protein
MAVMFWGEGMRVGVVEREDTMEEGREARKALSILIVRGTCDTQQLAREEGGGGGAEEGEEGVGRGSRGRH